MNILLTGGAGYIGTHTAVELIEAGHSIVIIDSLINSSKNAIIHLERLTNSPVVFYEGDVRSVELLRKIFSSHSIDAVIHLAGLKSVGESVRKPLEYYSNNIDSTLSLIETMETHNVKKLVFSSSATVYGNPESLPLTEESPVGTGITNPYGWTKYMVEQILTDYVTANPSFEATVLRYFNPIGAHPSGIIGEDPNDTPNNIFPYIAQTAAGKLHHVNIFGSDYDTSDGTGVRDYIHIVDLAKGHVAALMKSAPGIEMYNLGSGRGTSVLELIKAFETACAKTIAYKFVERRPGDVAVCYASATLANDKLSWKAEKSIDDACRDSWKWQSDNPNGYR